MDELKFKENAALSPPELQDFVSIIEPASVEAMKDAKERQDYRVKVPGSLGYLEEISIRLAGITGKPFGNDVTNQAIILMCGDNGVVEEGVASAPQSVTQMQTINFTRRITGVGAQAKYFDIDLLTIDVGVKLPIPKEYLCEEMAVLTAPPEELVEAVIDIVGEKEAEKIDELRGKMSLASKVVNRSLGKGTRNLAKEPAMTREEAIQAIMVGIEAVNACKAAGKTLIGVGEMGIGNTTTASAIIAALAAKENPSKNPDEYIEEIVGRGGGLSDEGLRKKKEIIKHALEKYEDLYLVKEGEASYLEPIELLRCVGGYDIAAMAGAYLGAAAKKIPAVVDGVISIAAALLAVRICPHVKDYLFTSHRSLEGGYAVAERLLGIRPMYDLGMRLGEGSGCPIAFKIIEAAAAVINNMWSLEEAQVSSEYLEEFRNDGQFERKG